MLLFPLLFSIDEVRDKLQTDEVKTAYCEEMSKREHDTGENRAKKAEFCGQEVSNKSCWCIYLCSNIEQALTSWSPCLHSSGDKTKLTVFGLNNQSTGVQVPINIIGLFIILTVLITMLVLFCIELIYPVFRVPFRLVKQVLWVVLSAEISSPVSTSVMWLT